FAGPRSCTIASLLLTSGSGVRRQGPVIRVLRARSDRRRPEEPGEKSEFLQMVCEPVWAWNGLQICLSQRIPHFQIAPAAGQLADVAPRRCEIGCARVVHPLR